MWYSQYPWNPVLQFVLIAVVSYLAGGINGSIITSQTLYKKDIREYGSGNAGLTNFHRVFGKSAVFMVVAIDVLKAAVPVLFSGWLMGLSGRAIDGVAFSGFFVLLGNSYPLYYNFKGGKTVMASATIVWFVDWRVGLILLVIFVTTVLATHYVSLGSVLSGAVYPIALAVISKGQSYFAVVMVALGAALLIYRHKENIKRLLKGTESKLKF